MKILVTGGAGFLGSYICRDLLKQGHEVTSFSRKTYQKLEDRGIRSAVGDIRDYDSVLKALEGQEAVFHVASLAGIWGNKKTYFDINVTGTKNLVKASKELNIKYFVYTSSPSVVFSKGDLINENESLAYPKKYLTVYAHTKAQAEKYVLDANSEDFKTVSLRPHLIWGPGDPHIFPRLLLKGKKGQLRIVGNGENLVDIIYVENASLAHVQAFTELIKSESAVAGQAYFLGQAEPVNLWDFINKVLKRAGIEEITSYISFTVAYMVGWLFEMIYSLFGIYSPEPPMTRFVACNMGKNHYFCHDKAKRDFNYNPVISVEEGLNRTFDQSM